MENPKQIVVVGGGFLGAMAAILFSQRKDMQISVIEKQNRMGGLYNSAWEKNGYFFDFGSRVILPSGVELVDNILMDLLPEEQYPRSTENIREFSFQNGKHCEYSNCLDARTLPKELFEKGKEQLLAIKENSENQRQFSSLAELAQARYGKVFTDHLIRPAMTKLTGLSLENLDPNTLQIHGLSRIIIADSEESKELKSLNSFNDMRIAFSKYDDNKSSLLKLYPKSKGLSDFGKRVKNYLESLPNVNLYLENAVENIEHTNHNVTSIKLEGGQQINCDNLIWTIPSIWLASLLDQNTSSLKPPVFRNSVLAHYIFKGSVNTKAYFVYNYDPKFRIFRSSFYENFSELPSNLHSVTIEMFHDAPNPDLETLRDELFQELKDTATISNDSAIVDSNMQYCPATLPNFAVDFFSNQHIANETIAGDYENVHLLGKANGQHHCAVVVNEAYELYKSLLN